MVLPHSKPIAVIDSSSATAMAGSYTLSFFLSKLFPEEGKQGFLPFHQSSWVAPVGRQLNTPAVGFWLGFGAS